ncbi:hypothetical protein ACWJJH_02835 [Endozoicomonadaceae bacterium StTr2]
MTIPIPTNKTIANQLPDEPARNFNTLRDEGLELIAKLAGSQWTDHNLHDPGITFMEAASFAITDLGYRLGFPMKDLLAQPEQEKQLLPFHPDSDALPCQPLTTNDYSKVLLQLPGIRHVELTPNEADNGLWNIRVVPDSIDARPEQELITAVRQCFISHRNLGEDLGSIKVLETTPVSMRLFLTLESEADPAETLARVLVSIAEAIAPVVSFESRQTLLQRGIHAETVDTGPWLDQGYIDDAALAVPAIPSQIYASRLVSRVLDQPGIVSAEALQFHNNDPQADGCWESWVYSPEIGKAPVLDLEQTLKNVRLIKQDIEVTVPTARVISRFNQLRGGNTHAGRESSIPQPARYRSVSRYHSLQHDLPSLYKVGPQGIAPGETADNIAAIRQLQAYLMLPDQLLANEFAQLDRIRHLLGLPDAELLQPLQQLMEQMQASLPLNDSAIGHFWRLLKQLPVTHDSQAVAGLSELEAILSRSPEDYPGNNQTSDVFQALTEQSFSIEQLQRYNRVLAHLLARFHEQTPDSSLLRYEELYRHYAESLLAHPEAMANLTPDELVQRLALLKNLLDRAAFLLDIPRTGGHRGQAGNYLDRTIRGQDNISGVRHRIYRRLGLPRVAMDTLASHNGEGFHLVEGVLLRHAKGAESGVALQAKPDEVFIVIPDWPSRFDDPDFAQLFVDTVHRELPLHITPRLLWLDRKAMAEFEQVHHAWLNALSVQPFPLSNDDQVQYSRLQQLSSCLDRFISGSLAGNKPDISGWPVAHRTLQQYQDDQVTFDRFVVGYTPANPLHYDPDDPDSGRIEKLKVNPDNPDDSPFVIRIRKPYSTRDS